MSNTIASLKRLLPSFRHGLTPLLLACAIVLHASIALGEQQPSTRPPATSPAQSPGQPKDTRRHDEFVKIAKAGDIDVVFLGDSITDFWRRAGKKVWAQYFSPLKAANFGIAGDGTKGVLWRIQNGELDGFHPKLVVLLIGTNNISEKPEAIALGIKAIISEIQTRSPGTRIVLLGIFPRGGQPDAAGRQKIIEVNKLISAYAHADDPSRVIFLDIGDKFLNADKSMNKELMPDTLHPSEKGYQLWAESMIETINQQLSHDAQARGTTRPTSE